MLKIEYKDDYERIQIIEEETLQGFFLVEDCIQENLKYLVFREMPNPIPDTTYVPTLEEKINLQIAQNTAETIEVITLLNEMQRIEQAQSNAELIELIMTLQGGM